MTAIQRESRKWDFDELRKMIDEIQSQRDYGDKDSVIRMERYLSLVAEKIDRLERIVTILSHEILRNEER